MVTSALLKRVDRSVDAVAVAALVFHHCHPRLTVDRCWCAQRKARTTKVRREICLILFGEALQSVSDCLMHSAAVKLSRMPRDRGNGYWLRVRPSGLTSDSQNDYIIFHRELFRTLPVTVMIYRWIIARAVAAPARPLPGGIRTYELASGIQCIWTVAESRSPDKVR